MSNLRRFLLYFAQEHVEFRYPEISSIIKLFNLDIKVPSPTEKPYWILENVVESDLRKIASRSVSLRFIVEVWGSGKTFPEFHESLQTFCKTLDPQPETSFKITVETYNKHLQQKEKVDRIETMDYLPLLGKIDLKKPDINLIYFEFWGMDPNELPELPEEIVFGRWIAEGQRDMVNSILLTTRKFIGNTSMKPLLSLLMANQGKCDKNQLVFDPFAGTGSLLISAAKFGSYVIGSDIDFMMLHGRTKPSRVNQKKRAEDESIKANMIQYNLQHLYLDIFVADFSNCPLSDAFQLDAIITDPPYGIREKMEQIVAKEPKKTTVLSEEANHFPSTSNYSTKGMYDDLLIFSAKHLKLGGRLVCWFPVTNDDYSEKILPQHTALELVANSEQKLTGFASRRLLTYEKIQDSGVIMNNIDLEELDFRMKYFGQNEVSRRDRGFERHLQNIIEAQKRGITIEANVSEKKKLSNKKRLLERNKRNE